MKLLILITGLVVLKLAVMLTAPPKPTVDYLAQANELGRPAGYTPADNAAPLYEKALALYVAPPEELLGSPLIGRIYQDNGSILAGVDPNDLSMAKQWLEDNRSVLEQARLASHKPTCWFDLVSEDGSLVCSADPDIYPANELNELLVCSAKCRLLNHQFSAAAEDLFASCRLGIHLNRPTQSFSVQFESSRIAEMNMTAAFEAIAYAKPSASELESFRRSFRLLLPGFAISPDFQFEKLVLYDLVQRLYLDPVRGIDRPAFRMLMSKDLLNTWGWTGRENWRQAFTGPSRYSVLQKIDRLIALHEQLKDKTPWQIHQAYQAQAKEARELTEDGFFMRNFALCYLNLLARFAETYSRAQALVAVMTVLLYQQDHGRLPESLEALQAAGYLETLPMDPYSDGPLVYKAEGDAFTLYSVGEDFQDSGGIPLSGGENPVVDTRFIRRLTEGQTFQDIIYWPVLVETPNPQQPMPAMGEELL